jgi:hypothetical protein
MKTTERCLEFGASIAQKLSDELDGWEVTNYYVVSTFDYKEPKLWTSVEFNGNALSDALQYRWKLEDEGCSTACIVTRQFSIRAGYLESRMLHGRNVIVVGSRELENGNV